MLAYRFAPVAGKTGRQFGTTAVRTDFMSWFKRNKKNKDVESSAAVQPELQRDTKEVLSEIESGKTTEVKSSTVTKLALTEDDFIGIDLEAQEKKVRAAKLKEVPFNEWLSVDKVDSKQQLQQVITESYQETFGNVPTEEQLGSRFESLEDKFHFTKRLQSKSGYMIPDYQLTTLQRPKEFQTWFETKVLSGSLGKFREAEPNAIDLSNIKFPPNVHVVPDIKPSVKKQKVQKILEEVSALEAQLEREAIEKARNG